ncbi:hypothetical protein [Paractinoplanes hotanensis]|uniref:Uncharacterized protein n=1 Tax=Paractinoplanes hotanensis TaxID=2906497 RepID=A0ABT0Y748_9ACTN|nr:hypothetical protein [Actinoplanes hotanensis]MCM4081867.1 hypothetical protein [Actinoplanes hotanensis]
MTSTWSTPRAAGRSSAASAAPTAEKSTHYFDDEHDARAMIQRMRIAAPAGRRQLGADADASGSMTGMGPGDRHTDHARRTTP